MKVIFKKNYKYKSLKIIHTGMRTEYIGGYWKMCGAAWLLYVK